MITRLASAILVSLVFLLGLGAAQATAAPNGTYKGQTEGELKVKIKVKNNRITKFTSPIYASCGLSNFLISFAYPPAGKKGSIKIKGNGSFKVVFNGNPGGSPDDDKRTLKGKFKGGKVSGSMKVEGVCSAETTFKAHK